ncbi:class C sortase [Dubosiella newyorkensis]|uniref:class C sortase n=4 Tax=Dubosiella TaxID=1937008 RepID=UPI0025B2DACF|nr:class C sortase [Dubosiella newyorkensis]
MKKSGKKNHFWTVVWIVGIICCSYPLVASIYESYIQKDTISTFSRAVESADPVDVDTIMKEAREYNDLLWQARGAIVGRVDADFYSDQNYNDQLKFGDSDVMARIEIPKINVDLPIYHGTSEEILKIGVGHLQGTSLPVGGESSRSILTGHRGLPNSKLFTRLDELVKGDLFYITTGDETLAYKVSKIEVIEPEEMDTLDTQAGKDLVTLITCTPYGLNTHRLLVTGERVPYQALEKDAIVPGTMSLREIVFAVLPFAFIGVAAWPNLKKFIRRKK